MITTFLLYIVGFSMDIFASTLSKANAVFNFPVDTVTNAISYWIAPSLYFQGVFPIDTALQILGLVAAFLSTLLIINIFEWLWHKLPWLGH